ncbi:MAG: hypothetical protein AAFN74_05680 [Myxococcota bacterium]
MRVLLLVVGTLVACGPITSTSRLIDAAAEVAAARTAGADQTAPYELATAEVFLAQAREEQGRAQFEQAVELAERSVNCARAAIARSQVAVPAKLVREPVPSPLCRPRRMDVPAELASTSTVGSVSEPAIDVSTSTASRPALPDGPLEPDSNLADELVPETMEEQIDDEDKGSRP